MPNCTMDRLEGAVAGQLQCLVRWLVAWRALLPDLACCTSNVKRSGGLRSRCDLGWVVTGAEFNSMLRFQNTKDPRNFYATITRFNAPISDRLSGKHDGIPLCLIRREAKTQDWVGGIINMEFHNIT
jgi:hypothetical protein